MSAPFRRVSSITWLRTTRMHVAISLSDRKVLAGPDVDGASQPGVHDADGVVERLDHEAFKVLVFCRSNWQLGITACTMSTSVRIVAGCDTRQLISWGRAGELAFWHWTFLRGAFPSLSQRTQAF